MILTEPVLEGIRGAATCWFASEDARGRPHMAAREAWAPLGPEAVVLADTLSPVTARNLRLNPWAVAGFLDPAGRTGWRIEGPARTLSPGEPGFAEAARVERIATPEVPLIPDRAAKGIALMQAARRRGEGSGATG
jgi:predicted pyridoxine 5'-phosphate oxidase superfamily flavin-nucleotide-binding protein